MEASKVYYTDFRCPVGTSLLDKLRRVCIAAGIKDIDMDGKFVAIKMHFGELGNLAFLRPNYAKVVADLCKEQGGLPFLTDCNTLYPGSRKNALEHTCKDDHDDNDCQKQPHCGGRHDFSLPFYEKPTKPIDFFGSCGYAPIIRKTGPVQIPRTKIFYGVSLAHWLKRRGFLWSI